MLGSTLGHKKHKEKPTSIPLEKGKDFQLTISAEANSFDIFIEKKKYYSYQYREDVTKVKKIVFEGNGSMASLSIGKVIPYGTHNLCPKSGHTIGTPTCTCTCIQPSVFNYKNNQTSITKSFKIPFINQFFHKSTIRLPPPPS